MRPKVTVHKCAVIFRTWILFEGGPYMKKYSNVQDLKTMWLPAQNLFIH